MKTYVLVNGDEVKEFHCKYSELPAELKHLPAVEVDCHYGIKANYYNSNWQLKHHFMKEYTLIDYRKEGRTFYMPFNLMREIIKYSSWEDYDISKLKEENQKLKEEVNEYYKKINQLHNENWELEKIIASREDTISKLHESLREIYFINESAGAGSRRKVREIILSLLPSSFLNEEE